MQINVNKTKMYSLLEDVCKQYLVDKSSKYHFYSMNSGFQLFGYDFKFFMFIDEEMLTIFVFKKESGNFVDLIRVNYQEEYHYFKLLCGLKIITL